MQDMMKHKDFFGSVNFSTDDNIFFGKVEDINDLITFEGATVDDLENCFQSMVEAHINDDKSEE